MMEIKFKAWNKAEKKMFPVKSLNFYTGYVNSVGNLPMQHCQCLAFEDVQLLQFTGLKDIDGIEIYEGDIVKTKQAMYEDVSVIIWDFTEFKLKSIRELPHCSWGKFRYGTKTPICSYFEFEVIGNIFETPELLEVKQ